MMVPSFYYRLSTFGVEIRRTSLWDTIVRRRRVSHHALKY
jgi:hypothetical protein